MLLVPVFISACATAEKPIERICLVISYIPINPLSGKLWIDLPPITKISCDSTETQQALIKGLNN